MSDGQEPIESRITSRRPRGGKKRSRQYHVQSPDIGLDETLSTMAQVRAAIRGKLRRILHMPTLTCRFFHKDPDVLACLPLLEGTGRRLVHLSEQRALMFTFEAPVHRRGKG